MIPDTCELNVGIRSSDVTWEDTRPSGVVWGIVDTLGEFDHLAAARELLRKYLSHIGYNDNTVRLVKHRVIINWDKDCGLVKAPEISVTFGPIEFLWPAECCSCGDIFDLTCGVFHFDTGAQQCISCYLASKTD